MPSRTLSASRNIAAGLLNKACTLLLPFASRTALIHVLGVEYVGLSSLFTSVLNVLSLAELGVGTALVYMMYRPMIEGDDGKICALLALYRRWYRRIGLSMLAIGVLLAPFLPLLVGGEMPPDVNLYVLYGIYLGNSVLSYLMFAWKQSAFTASQRADVVSNVGSALAVVSAALQVAALALTRSYYLFSLALPLVTCLQNLAVSALFDRAFPRWRPAGEVSRGEFSAITSNIVGLLVQKVGNVFLTSVDSLVISAFLGLAALGAYNNYWMIVTAVAGLMAMVTSNLIPSVGNSIAAEGMEKNRGDFAALDFIYTWLAAWSGSCIMALAQPFAEVWVGSANMLSDGMVSLLATVFFTNRVNDMTYVYRDAAGLWREGRFVPLAAACVNLAVNLVLVNAVGLPGVCISTIVSLLAIYTPFYTRILFKSYFRDMAAWRSYVALQFVRTAVFVAVAAACQRAVASIPLDGVAGLLASFGVMLVLPNLLLLAAYGWTRGFRQARGFFMRTVGVKSFKERG